MSRDPQLADHAHNVHSQCGEDGILDAVLRRLPSLDRWCVEFGAWDGEFLSNTRKLVEDGYSAVLIEADPARVERLREANAGRPAVTVIEGYVGWEGATTLDNLLAGTGIPEGFDLLSIDIDGNDYHVWKAVRRHRPKVVVIEFNPTIPDDVVFVQDPGESVRKGSSARALVELAREKGYRLAATTVINAIFVREDLFEHLGVEDTRLSTLRRDHSWEVRAFFGYDGRLHLLGGRRMPWHRAPLPDEVRLVPKPIDGFPGDFGPVRKVVWRLWTAWRRRRDG